MRYDIDLHNPNNSRDKFIDEYTCIDVYHITYI